MPLYKKSFLQSLIFLLIFLVNIFSVAAQPSQIIFKHYSVAEGFSSNEAFDITNSSEGLIWISSGDGLARYDSKSFKFYRHDNNDTNTISHNYCSALQTDKRNWIWVVADDDLDIFDPATEIFHHVKLAGKKGENAQLKPKTFYYDQEKDIMWVGTLNGLYFSKAGSFVLQSAATISADTTFFTTPILTINPDNNDWLWLTSTNKIIKFHTKTGATQHFSIPPIVSGNQNNGNIYIASSYLDRNSILWMGTVYLGLFSFNTNTLQFEQYTYQDIRKQQNTIFSITQTVSSNLEDVLFVGATELGFAAFNTQKKQFTSYYSPFYNTSLGIKGDVYGLHNFDNKLWIGSSTGLHCYDFSLQLFEKKDFSNIANGISLLPTEHLNVERNNKGIDERLWFFVPYKNAYIYHLLKDSISPIPSKLTKYTSVGTGIFSAYIDSKNILWLATNLYGLIGYDIKKDTIYFTEKKYFHKNLEWVHHFYEDNLSNLWVCTYNGLYVMNSSRKEVTSVSVVNNLVSQNKISKRIVGITQDENGIIWLTADYSNTKNAGIIKFDPQKNTASIVYKEAVTNVGNNPAVDIRDICSNKKGKIFVSFRNQNIFWFHSNEKDSITLFELGRKQGLNSAAIDRLLSDSSGNLWCSNSFGIAQYITNQNSFSNYALAQYELNTTNNPFIYISPNSGKFYIGQSNGFLLFNSANNRNDISTTNLLFNNLEINNTSYPHKISDGDQLLLNYQQDMISIEFALLSYSNSDENTYGWMLEGLETEWNISKNNVATYNHLSPGRYRLLVKAANSNGDWKTTPIELYFTITPPFYATWWFRIMCALLLAGGIWAIVQRRFNRIKNKFALQNQIASDLHDEIGSTLTSINILSNVTQQAMGQEPRQAKEMLQQISNQSKTIQQNMSDIVWSIRSDNDKIENLVARIREFAAQTLEPLQIDTMIDADDVMVAKILPMQYRKDMLLICKEAINNIARHANATTANIVFSTKKNDISVIITDNGKWKGLNSGTGTKTMQERANALGGNLTIEALDTGTTVFLSLPLP